MKKTLAFTAAALLAANSAFAGGLAEPMMEAEPVMEPEVVVAESGSSGGFVIPLLLIAVIAAIAANGSGDSASIPDA